MQDTITLLETRRSAMLRDMGEPGPDAAQLQTLLRIGARVPDHGKLVPWRFIVIQGAAREKLGGVLARASADNAPGQDGHRAAGVNRFERVPVVVTVVSKVVDHIKVPHWEQILSAGAVCQNMLVAAAALGFSGQWITDWPAYDPAVLAALGLGEGERVAGFICLGTVDQKPGERPRPDLADIVTQWPGRGHLRHAPV